MYIVYITYIYGFIKNGSLKYRLEVPKLIATQCNERKNQTKKRTNYITLKL